MAYLICWTSFKYALIAIASTFWVNYNSSSSSSSNNNDGVSQRTAEETFINCLKFTSADISYPSNATWWYDSQGVSVPVLRHPIAVAYATCTRQVTALVKCAVQNNVKPVPRSGGHSVEAFSSQDGKLVIDISRINFVKVHPKQQNADVGAGVRLGKLYYEIGKYRLGFPAGTCPTVGLGGHVAVGGYGDLTRIWGMAADNVLSMMFVDWQGNVLVANDSSNADLFFALRAGGGGSYGIVTEMRLKLHRFPKSSTAFNLSWKRFPATADLIRTWFEWKPWATMPAQMKLIVLVGANIVNGLYVGDDGAAGVARIFNESGLLAIGHEPVLMNFSSANLLLAKAWLLNENEHYGDESRDYQILNTGAYGLGPLNLPPYPARVHQTWTQIQNDTRVNNTQDTNSEWTTKDRPIVDLKPSLIGHDYYKYTSQMITKEFNAELAEQLDEFLGHGGISIWEPHGGVMGIEPEVPNAFAHRKALFNVQHFVPYNMSSADGVRQQNEVCHKLAASMEPYTSHTSYQGYPDLYWTTHPRIYMPRYFGPHVDRLVAVKNKYDPHNYFSNPQSTPLEL